MIWIFSHSGFTPPAAKVHQGSSTQMVCGGPHHHAAGVAQSGENDFMSIYSSTWVDQLPYPRIENKRGTPQDQDNFKDKEGLIITNGSVAGEKRATGWPFLSMMNLVKFHLMKLDHNAIRRQINFLGFPDYLLSLFTFLEYHPACPSGTSKEGEHHPRWHWFWKTGRTLHCIQLQTAWSVHWFQVLVPQTGCRGKLESWDPTHKTKVNKQGR